MCEQEQISSECVKLHCELHEREQQFEKNQSLCILKESHAIFTLLSCCNNAALASGCKLINNQTGRK